ncbi:diacylglycerol kinase family lipid kinase [Echinicola marina]|uniref:diacylglycerol/lipid kinase family protein n=1 Tax=Echinicola marina TaxID=2859768 RepID=UPI001CF6682A|nr:diacylglycerol kinase family protein [Echinicola marina]UCS92384.1 diacylglycerol kinase family lipid kinase [Echinicola marina]
MQTDKETTYKVLKKKRVIHFIINPISGKGNNFLDKVLLQGIFPESKYELIIKITGHLGHASELALGSISEAADVIVACGGDGTINEIASCLIGHNIPLGIIPLGSGNGLASNLGIPSQVDKALKILSNGTIREIDVGRINEKYFFSNMGIGFDAALIAHYNQLNRRQLRGYFTALISTLKTYNSTGNINITLNGKNFTVDPFLLFISNSNRMGYGFTLTPNASLSDGKLDMVLVKKLSKFQMFLLSLFTVTKSIKVMKSVNYQLIDQIEINANNNLFQYQIDGELISERVRKLNISLASEKLTVLVPNN